MPNGIDTEITCVFSTYNFEYSINHKFIAFFSPRVWLQQNNAHSYETQ